MAAAGLLLMAIKALLSAIQLTYQIVTGTDL